MLGFIKYILRLMIIPALYFGGIYVIIVTIFSKVEWGLYLMVGLIPQPNIWYKFQDYPMGNSFLDFIFFSIVIGLIYQRKGFEITSNSTIIFIFIAVSYLSLWNSSMRFSLPIPLTLANNNLADWKNFVQMVLLYFLALNAIKTEDKQKGVILLMSVIILLVAIRSYRNFSGGDSFSYDKRVGGPFETVGLGANHFGAFIAHYCPVFLSLFFFDREKKWKTLIYLGVVLFGLHPLFFSYSRGAYLAFFAVLIFYGLFKKRSLLVFSFLIIIAWQAILPASVVDRIKMTRSESGEIEHSAGGRLELWDIAYQLFEKNPIFGVGFNGYSMSVGGMALKSGEQLPEGGFDSHNYYMKVLSEEGIIGISVLALILIKAFFSGWRLYRNGTSQFYQGLGFGFMGCVIAASITNMFGDRFSYFVLGGYFWILWGLVDRGVIDSNIAKTKTEKEGICLQSSA